MSFLSAETYSPTEDYPDDYPNEPAYAPDSPAYFPAEPDVSTDSDDSYVRAINDPPPFKRARTAADENVPVPSVRHLFKWAIPRLLRLKESDRSLLRTDISKTLMPRYVLNHISQFLVRSRSAFPVHDVARMFFRLAKLGPNSWRCKDTVSLNKITLRYWPLADGIESLYSYILDARVRRSEYILIQPYEIADVNVDVEDLHSDEETSDSDDSNSDSDDSNSDSDADAADADANAADADANAADADDADADDSNSDDNDDLKDFTIRFTVGCGDHKVIKVLAYLFPLCLTGGFAFQTKVNDVPLERIQSVVPENPPPPRPVRTAFDVLQYAKNHVFYDRRLSASELRSFLNDGAPSLHMINFYDDSHHRFLHISNTTIDIDSLIPLTAEQADGLFESCLNHSDVVKRLVLREYDATITNSSKSFVITPAVTDLFLPKDAETYTQIFIELNFTGLARDDVPASLHLDSSPIFARVAQDLGYASPGAFADDIRVVDPAAFVRAPLDTNDPPPPRLAYAAGAVRVNLSLPD